MNLVRAHAFGNEFGLGRDEDVPQGTDRGALARALCERHRGIGADGLITFRENPGGAGMDLRNADGSFSEVSGNGVRCLAAWLASRRGMRPGDFVEIETAARGKRLELQPPGAKPRPPLTFPPPLAHPDPL